jgi:uncharacterized RDD family membrane protein YckC
VVERRDFASWLSGPRAALEGTDAELGYRGQRLGRPESGAGSVAGFGVRLLALLIDWVASLLVVHLLWPDVAYGTPDYSQLALGVFAVEAVVLVWLLQSSFGQFLCRIRVEGLDRRRLALWRVAVRTVLLCLVVPALVWDRDGRGLHDRAVGSVVVRIR